MGQGMSERSRSARKFFGPFCSPQGERGQRQMLLQETSLWLARSTFLERLFAPCLARSTPFERLIAPWLPRSTLLERLFAPWLARSTLLERLFAPWLARSTLLERLFPPWLARSTLLERLCAPWLVRSTLLERLFGSLNPPRTTFHAIVCKRLPQRLAFRLSGSMLPASCALDRLFMAHV